ncbi:MAG: hypothetical protein ABI383_14905 [Acidobacteriaceae bacterium]
MAIHMGGWACYVSPCSLLACGFLYFGFGLRRIAAELYGLTVALGAWLLWANQVAATTVPWITALVPALLCALMLAAGIDLLLAEALEEAREEVLEARPLQPLLLKRRAPAHV